MSKSQKSETLVVSVRMPTPMYGQIKTLAERDQRSVSAMIVRVLRTGLDSSQPVPASESRRSAGLVSGTRRGRSSRSRSSSEPADGN